MVNEASNIEIYGGDEDAVSVGPFPTAIPPGLAELPAGMAGVGWLSEDGITWSDSLDKVTITAHQGGVEVIEVTTKIARSFKFQCLETTALTMGLRYPGFKPTGVAPAGAGGKAVYGGEVPTPINDPRTWVIDTFSISNPGNHERKVIPKGQVSTTGDLVAKRGEVSILEFEVKVMEGKFFIYSNSAGMAPATP